MAKEIPSSEVLENDDVYAFRDITPAAPTHVLVVPKVHVANVTELANESEHIAAALLRAAADVAALEGLENGYRVVTNTGSDAGQSVDHLHFHVLGGRDLAWPPG